MSRPDRIIVTAHRRSPLPIDRLVKLLIDQVRRQRAAEAAAAAAANESVPSQPDQGAA